MLINKTSQLSFQMQPLPQRIHVAVNSTVKLQTWRNTRETYRLLRGNHFDGLSDAEVSERVKMTMYQSLGMQISLWRAE